MDALPAEPPRFSLDTTSRFLSPTWLNAVYGQTLVAAVQEDGQTVEVRGERLRAGQAFEPGTELYCHFGRQFQCSEKLATDVYLSAVQERERLRAEQARQQAEARVAARQAEADAFWEQNTPPFRFGVAHFEMLAGLSSRSSGGATVANTVSHVVALEPMKAGRLSRAAGEALCGAKSQRRHAAPWVFLPGSAPNEGQSFRPAKPTCGSCCSALERCIQRPEKTHSSPSRGR